MKDLSMALPGRKMMLRLIRGKNILTQRVQPDSKKRGIVRIQSGTPLGEYVTPKRLSGESEVLIEARYWAHPSPSSREAL